MAYLLDANVFIQAKNLHYGFDFCPAFWEWLLAQNQKGIVISIDKIQDELTAGEDELSEWVKNLSDGFFLPLDEKMAKALPKVSKWVIGSQRYRESAINTFFQVADYYLVAFALAHQHVVVTHEIATNAEKTVKIPDACIGVQVKFMTPFEMLRAERARFVLGKAK